MKGSMTGVGPIYHQSEKVSVAYSQVQHILLPPGQGWPEG